MIKIIFLLLSIVILQSSLLFGNSFKVNEAEAVVRPGKINLESVTIQERGSQRDAGDRLLTAKKLLAPTGNSIGNAYMICTVIGKGGTLGNGVSQCSATYNLPLGKLIAHGSRHSRSGYTLVVTGGTGFYRGAEGVLNSFLVGINPRRHSIVIMYE